MGACLRIAVRSGEPALRRWAAGPAGGALGDAEPAVRYRTAREVAAWSDAALAERARSVLAVDADEAGLLVWPAEV